MTKHFPDLSKLELKKDMLKLQFKKENKLILEQKARNLRKLRQIVPILPLYPVITFKISTSYEAPPALNRIALKLQLDPG